MAGGGEAPPSCHKSKSVQTLNTVIFTHETREEAIHYSRPSKTVKSASLQGLPIPGPRILDGIALVRAFPTYTEGIYTRCGVVRSRFPASARGISRCLMTKPIPPSPANRTTSPHACTQLVFRNSFVPSPRSASTTCTPLQTSSQ